MRPVEALALVPGIYSPAARREVRFEGLFSRRGYWMNALKGGLFQERPVLDEVNANKSCITEERVKCSDDSCRLGYPNMICQLYDLVE